MAIPCFFRAIRESPLRYDIVGQGQLMPTTCRYAEGDLLRQRIIFVVGATIGRPDVEIIAESNARPYLAPSLRGLSAERLTGGVP